jgi:TetR/AcrR family transcriptional regulator, regulator of autoinduction and epiphytic fitness
MSKQISPKRQYDSSRRKEQAHQTHLQIIEAARRLFFSSGYAGTTIEMIAREAGVATETVYAIFGNKTAILTKLVNVSVVGDDEPIPLLERPHIQTTSQIKDPHKLLEIFASDIYNIMQRMSPVFLLLRTTSKSEPEIAALLDKLLKERLKGMAFFVSQLARLGSLRENLNLEKAAETVWTISSGEVFHLLTVDRGWTKEQYVNWLADILGRVLLD